MNTPLEETTQTVAGNFRNASLATTPLDQSASSALLAELKTNAARLGHFCIKAADFRDACRQFRSICMALLQPGELKRLLVEISCSGDGVINPIFHDLLNARVTLHSEIAALREQKNSLGIEIAQEALTLREKMSEAFHAVIREREDEIQKNCHLKEQHAREHEAHLQRISNLKAEIRDLELRKHEIRSEAGIAFEPEVERERIEREIIAGFSAVLRSGCQLGGWTLNTFPTTIPDYFKTSLIPSLLAYEDRFGAEHRARLVGGIIEESSNIFSELTGTINLFEIWTDSEAKFHPAAFSTWLHHMSLPGCDKDAWSTMILRHADAVVEKIPLAISAARSASKSLEADAWQPRRAARDTALKMHLGTTSISTFIQAKAIDAM